MIFMSKEEAPLTTAEKQVAIRRKRSTAEKVFRKFTAANGKLEAGAGKGKEPKPWCDCHNRNPCPIDVELSS